MNLNISMARPEVEGSRKQWNAILSADRRSIAGNGASINSPTQSIEFSSSFETTAESLRHV